MAEIRLSKLIKQFNIGLDTLVDFLNSKGAGIESANPNMKVSDEYVPELHKKFGKDLELKEAAEKVDVKLTEILDKASKKQDDEEDEYEPERITVIKSNNLSRTVSAAPVEEPAPAPEEPEQESPEEPAPAPVEQAPAVEPEPAPEEAPVAAGEEPEAKAEPEPAPEAEPEAPKEEKTAPTPAESAPSAQAPAPFKVVGKIDLAQFDPKKGKKRERIKGGGSQKVDVTKVQAEKAPKKNDNKKKQADAGGKGRKKGDRFKPAMTEAEQEELQKEIQKQVKETYARMNESTKNNFGAKHRKAKREIAAIRRCSRSPSLSP